MKQTKHNKNFFQVMKIYFQVMKNYFQVMKINFKGLQILLSAASRSLECPHFGIVPRYYQ